MKKKTCTKCGRTLPLSAFYKHKMGKNGLNPACKDCVKAQNKKNYEANREARLEYMRQYNEEHREERLEYINEWQSQNRDLVNAAQQRWRERNPERAREYLSTGHRRYRARVAGAEGSFTAKQFKALCKQYGNRCAACNEKASLTADHIVPLSQGGANDISNIQPLCQSCNSRKGTKSTDYRR